jgi:hypothetical protein
VTSFDALVARTDDVDGDWVADVRVHGGALGRVNK